VGASLASFSTSNGHLFKAHCKLLFFTTTSISQSVCFPRQFANSDVHLVGVSVKRNKFAKIEHFISKIATIA
jgi:hypothetical protein